MPVETKFAVILGAGFSKCAGLPLAGELSNFLLSDEFNTDLDKIITAAIENFLGKAFYWKKKELIPSLEDIFTMMSKTTMIPVLTYFQRGAILPHEKDFSEGGSKMQQTAKSQTAHFTL